MVAVVPVTQLVCAEAEATIDEVKLVLCRNFDEMMGLVRADQDIPVERRVKFRYESALAVEKCLCAVDQLFTASGGRAIFQSSRISRYFLDIHAARAHYANGPDKPARNFGGVQLGLKTVDFFI
jgi:3-hydroxy-9,10-secoandrosta-1,3,5(10)-triene-9,17-dione monooxygenase